MTATMADFDKVTLPWPAEGQPWDGLPMARLGLRAALYFDNGYEPALRRSLMTIIEQYVTFTGGRIRAYQRGGDRRRQAASTAAPIDLTPMRAAVDVEGAEFGIELSAEPDIAVASHWSMVTVASDTGYLLLHFPVAAFEGAAPHSFRHLFQKWCAELQVTHAYAGLGLALPVGGRSMHAALRNSAPFLTRCIGLDADYPSTTASWCRNGIRTVNWLTAINADWLAKVGGEATVLRVAGPEVQAMPYARGSIFVAGSSPQLGDVQSNSFPNAFASLGRAVAPLRTDIPIALFQAPPGYKAPMGFTSNSGRRMAEADELPSLHYTKAWMARFDGG
ncbi:MAG TPA: type VI immunity family protein [Burkholderiaceae bacterium]